MTTLPELTGLPSICLTPEKVYVFEDYWASVYLRMLVLGYQVAECFQAKILHRVTLFIILPFLKKFFHNIDPQVFL